MGIIDKIMSFKHCMMPSRSDFGSAGKNIQVGFPVYIATVKNVHMEENTVLRAGVCIQNGKSEHVYIKKYSAVGRDVSIVTNSHRSTVGIPQCILGPSHINDTSRNLTIGEDVWVGTRATILSGGDLGRGCIVGACSLVTKPVPPYALVAGLPAKIVGVKFSIEQILEHEKALYPKEERFSRDYLEDLFAKYYEGKRVYGVQTELSEEDKERLAYAKKKRRYIEPAISD